MQFYWTTLAVLAVWRITHLLRAEDGPWHAFARIRGALVRRSWGGALGCFYCLSLWIAAPYAYALGVDWPERLLLWPALSAGSILLERLTEPPPAVYFEKSEDPNVLLRSE
jgi:hypothetical protein